MTFLTWAGLDLEPHACILGPMSNPKSIVEKLQEARRMAMSAAMLASAAAVGAEAAGGLKTAREMELFAGKLRGAYFDLEWVLAPPTELGKYDALIPDDDDPRVAQWEHVEVVVGPMRSRRSDLRILRQGVLYPLALAIEWVRLS